MITKVVGNLVCNLNSHFAKVLLVKHVLVGVLEFRQGEDLVIDNGVDVVCLNGGVHVLKLLARADQQATDGAKVVEAVEERGLVL